MSQGNWDTFVAGAIGALVGSAGTIIATLITSKYNLKNTIVTNKYIIEKDIKKNLHDQRIAVYADLFERTGPLALHDVSLELGYDDVYETAKRLEDWYYKGRGGVLMTKDAEEKYVSLKKILDTYAEVAKKFRNYESKLSLEEGVNTKKSCIDFHNALRKELSIE